MTGQKHSVVIVEDHAVVARFLREVCNSFDLEIHGVAPNFDKAITLIHQTAPTFVLLDIRLGEDRDGVDVANAIKPLHPTAKVVYLTASTERHTMARAKETSPYAILTKPVKMNDLRRVFMEPFPEQAA